MKRQCGECQLCCTLLPVKAVNKNGGVKCQHQCATGCAVYGQLETVAPECRLWTCEWLNGNAGDLQRPDLSHIVIDVLPDYITIQDNESGEAVNIGALQVWIDPAHKDAHNDPALRAYLDQRGQRDGMVSIIRYGEAEGFVLFPPAMTGGQWIEHRAPPTERRDDYGKVVEKLAEIGITP